MIVQLVPKEKQEAAAMAANHLRPMLAKYAKASYVQAEEQETEMVEE
jgi:hypothetical protein